MNSQRTMRRMFALLLVLALVLTVIPATALAVTDCSRSIDCAQCQTAATEAISAEHQYVDDVCTVCQETRLIASGTCGSDIQWKLNAFGLLTLRGTGAMDDYAAASDAPWYSIRESIKTLMMDDRITTVGDRAFYSCSELFQADLGTGITTVGAYAFYGCTSLAAVTLPASVTYLKGSAFRECSSLMTVRMEGNAPTRENYVFLNCPTSQVLQFYEGSTGYDASPWQAAIDVPQHTGTWVVTAAPTCTTSGSRYIDCTHCKATFTETMPASHQFRGGVCAVCQETKARASGQCGTSAQWKLNVFGTLTISGTGAMADYSGAAPWHTYKEKITMAVIQSGITRIGDYAFYNCTNLTDVSMSERVTSIGCHAFSACSSITVIDIPEGVTSIDDYAFLGCSSLTSINIPEGVADIGVYAFYGCNSLTGITIPEGVTDIEHGMFYGCNGLISITIPGSVKNIGNEAFNGCNSLENVYISDLSAWCKISYYNQYSAPMYYAENLYLNNELLTDVTIPDDVTQLPDYAFYGCSSLTGVTIPEGVTGIGECAFYGCTDLLRVTIPDSVANIGERAFYNCWRLTDIIIPKSVTRISNNVFTNCSSLTRVAIPESVTSIGNSVFSNCSSLTDVTIPDSVTEIGQYAFATCTSLTSITIPSSVTSIGYNAFAGCTGLRTVTFLGSVPMLSASSFSGGVQATGYHSCTDATWTDAAKNSLSGIIAWNGHLYGDYVYNQDATCIQDGTMTGRCPECAAEDTVSVPHTATGHSFGSNGTCTICGAPDSDNVTTVIQPTLALKAPTLEFKDMICVVAFFTAENTQDVVEMGMITYTEKVDAVDIATAAHVIPGATYEQSSGRYFASSQGIHAKYLGDTVYLACYAKLTDGSYVYTKLAPYSPIQYADSQLKNSTDVKLKQLVVAMLNYGAEAQRYFGHNVENLANAALTADQLALPESYRQDMVQTVPAASAEKQGIFANNQGFATRKPAISFEGAFCINYFFTPKYEPVQGITLYYWNEADFNAADVLTTENATGVMELDGTGVGQYRGDITGIAAKSLSQAVYVAAIYSDGPTIWTSGVLGYSIGAYCSGQASKDGDIADLAKATAVYGYCAKQYFG